MTQTMTPAAWAFTEQLARREGLSDAQIAGLAIGCPAHGNAWMDFDDDGVFCHQCDRESTPDDEAELGAYEIGEEHGFHRTAMWSPAELLAYIAETDPQAAANPSARRPLYGAYAEGWHDARTR